MIIDFEAIFESFVCFLYFFHGDLAEKKGDFEEEKHAERFRADYFLQSCRVSESHEFDDFHFVSEDLAVVIIGSIVCMKIGLKDRICMFGS